jgi:hypothetical protein
MATAAAQRPVASPAPRDHLFYSGVAALMAITVFVGFARTYYLSHYFGTNATISGRPFAPIIRLHAALFTTWVLLFITQTSLVAARRTAVHRRLGVAGGVLAGLMCVVGPVTAIHAARLGSAPPGVDPLAFLAVPFGDIAMFAFLAAAGLVWRKDKEKHKRLMLLASTCLMAAPLARWPGVLPLGPLAYYGLTMLFVVAGATYDWFSRGRIHQVYLWGGPLLVLAVPVRLLLIASPAWRRLMQALIGG